MINTRHTRNELLSNDAARTKIARCYAGEIENYFTVVAETKSGRRFASYPNGMGPGMFPTMERAQRFAEKVKAKGSINETHWLELDPVYGSEASADEQAEASMYAEALGRGVIAEADVPEVFRALL